MSENTMNSKEFLQKLLQDQPAFTRGLQNFIKSGLKNSSLKVLDTGELPPLDVTDLMVEWKTDAGEHCVLEKAYIDLLDAKVFLQLVEKQQQEFRVSSQDIETYIEASEHFKGIVLFFNYKGMKKCFFLKETGEQFVILTSDEIQKEINKGPDQTAAPNQLSPDVDTGHPCKESGDNEKTAHLTLEHFCWGQKTVVPDNSPIADYAFLNTVSRYPIEETFRKDYLYELLKKEATNTSLDLLEKLILEKLKKEWQKG